MKSLGLMLGWLVLGVVVAVWFGVLVVVGRKGRR